MPHGPRTDPELKNDPFRESSHERHPGRGTLDVILVGKPRMMMPVGQPISVAASQREQLDH